MALIDMVFRLTDEPQTVIGAVRLDALVSEQTSLSCGVTQYAVEEGAPIGDHIAEQSERLTVEGVVTGAGVSLFGAHGRSKMVEAKEAFRILCENKQPITVMTGLDIYPDFAIESCDISRSAADGEQLHISISLVHIRKAQTRTADIPPGKVKPAAKGKAGQTKRPAGKAGGKASPKTAPSPKAAQKAKTAAAGEPRKSKLSELLGVGK